VLQAIEWIPNIRTEKYRKELEDEGVRFTNGEMFNDNGVNPVFDVPNPTNWSYRFFDIGDPTVRRTIATESTENYTNLYPVHYVEPLAGNGGALGLNLGSSSVRLAAINGAESSMEGVASAKIDLAQISEGPNRGFLYFEPMADEGGLILAVFKTDKLLSEMLKGYALKLMKIGLFDVTDDPAGVYLGHYFEGEDTGAKFFDYIDLDMAAWLADAVPQDKPDLENKYSLEIGTRKWTIICAVGEAYMSEKNTGLGWIMFAVCIATAVLATIGRNALHVALKKMTCLDTKPPPGEKSSTEAQV